MFDNVLNTILRGGTCLTLLYESIKTLLLTSNQTQFVSKDPEHHLSVRIFQMSGGGNFFYIIVYKKILVKVLYTAHMSDCVCICDIFRIMNSTGRRPAPGRTVAVLRAQPLIVSI